METATKHSSPLTELLSIAAPTVAQMASYTVMQFIDRWLLSRLGDVPATAAANSGILTFSLIALGMGVMVMVNTLVSQSFGRREFDRCGQFMWQGIWLAIAFGIALLPMRVFGDAIFRAFGHAPEIAALEAAYYRIILLSAGAKLVSTVLGQFFLGIDRASAVLISAVIGVAVNAVAAWLIVLGHCGFAQHGVVGAAWAQNIGVVTETLVLIVLLLRPSIRGHFNVADARLRLTELAMLVRIGVPSGLNWFSDVLAWSIFVNVVVGLLGPTAMAANTFMFSYMVMAFMPVYGLSTAVQALVGRYIGSHQPDISVKRAHLGFGLSALYMLGCAVVFITLRDPLMRVFTVDRNVIRVGGQYLIAAAIYGFSDALYLIYMGALRGAGDTFVPALAAAGLCWSVNVGGGYLLTRSVPRLGFAGPWIMGCIFGSLIGSFIFLRFAQGGWKRIHLVGQTGDHSNVLVPSATL